MKRNIPKGLKTAITYLLLFAIALSQIGMTYATKIETPEETPLTQSRADNFSKNYTLTGNGASDIVTVAFAQLGKTGSQLGYSEHWCADFVGDCALLAGQSAAIPTNGLVSTLKDNILAAGGYEVSIANAQPGDICFFHYSGNSSYWNHVEIVYSANGSTVSTIGGNSGSTGSLYTNSVKKHDPAYSVYKIFRPNYTATKPCTTHTKGSWLFYEAAHPHYNYWKCSVCGTNFTDGTKTTVNTCLECVDRNSRIYCWFSDEKMGAEVDFFEPGEWMYLCYKMYDVNTGDLFDSYRDDDYTATVTIYNYQTGEVEHTVQYNNDNNWIAIRRSAEGVYKGEVVLSGDFAVTTTTFAANYASTHTTIYDANGGCGAPAAQIRECIDGNETLITIPMTVPTRFGYNFIGWSTSATATTASYQPGDTPGLIYDPVTKSYNTVFYAVWVSAPTLSTTTQALCSPTINYPGAGFYYKFTPSVTTSYCIYGNITTDNIVFLYDASGNMLASDDDSGEGSQFELDYILTSGQTYYIYVKFYDSSCMGTLRFNIARGYKISYNANGGSGTPTDSYKYYAIDRPLSAVQPTRTGYSFVGWNTSSSGSGTSYQPGATYKTNSNITLYAQWTKGCANNSHTYTLTVTVPTCTMQGYTTHTCSACGDSYKDSYTAALGHSYSYKVTTTPTTTATGKLTGTCSRCSGATTVTLPNLNTTNYSYSVIKAATCTATGTGRYTWKTTTYGSFYFDVSIAKTSHSYKSTVTAPTCTAQGYTTHTCSACGDSYKDSYTAALGHSYSYKVTTTPTTTATGKLTGTCSRCSGATTVTLPNLNTTNYSYSVIKAATCTATGTGRYTWKTTTYGNFYFDVSIAKTSHSYKSTVTAPTCTAQGYTTHTCSVCGDSYVADEAAALGHSFMDGKCTVCGECDPDYLPENPFVDVKENDYFFTPVLWAVQEGVTNGISVAKFGPSNDCTRGQIVTFLWRACGSSEPKKTDNPFSDVKETDYYYKAVLWAVESGITNGMSATTFEPDATCTRGQVATFLWRSQGKPTPKSKNNPFKDVNSSEYYYNAVLWAVEKNVTNGTDIDTFSPDASCTRGQIVTFLYRALAE